MTFTLGKTKLQRFESYLLIFVLIIGFSVYGFMKLFESGYIVNFFNPEQNGKNYVLAAINKSQKMDNKCNWSGFVLHKKTGLVNVFLGCNVNHMLSNTEIKTKEQLMSAISTVVIAPLLSTFPAKDNVLVTAIAQVREDAVACIDIKNRIVVKSYFDTYENYCWPK